MDPVGTFPLQLCRLVRKKVDYTSNYKVTSVVSLVSSGLYHFVPMYAIYDTKYDAMRWEGTLQRYDVYVVFKTKIMLSNRAETNKIW